jgi:hypothetical protein
VPTVDLIDETYLVVDRNVLADVVHDPQRWRAWWPGFVLTVFMDRGPDGIRWSVSGPVVGSAELWLEAYGDGVLVHFYLRVDPAGGPAQASRSGARQADRLRRKYAVAWKQQVNALKDELERGRPPGQPRLG